MEFLFIYEGDMPECPTCGCKDKWIVKQKLVRASELLRIDGLGDMVVKPFDPNTYDESIALSCGYCASTFQPQSGVAATEDGRKDKIEAYDETSVDQYQIPDRFNNNREF